MKLKPYRALSLLIFLCPGWVEPVSPIRLTTSGTKAIRARRLYVSSLGNITQSWRDFPGRPCLQLASSLSAPRARGCGKEKVLDQLTFLQHDQWNLLCTQSLRLTCRIQRMLSLSKTVSIRSSAKSRNRRVTTKERMRNE